MVDFDKENDFNLEIHKAQGISAYFQERCWDFEFINSNYELILGLGVRLESTSKVKNRCV